MIETETETETEELYWEVDARRPEDLSRANRTEVFLKGERVECVVAVSPGRILQWVQTSRGRFVARIVYGDYTIKTAPVIELDEMTIRFD
jgi:hypothetical protein